MLRTSELSGLEAGRVSRMSQDLPGGKNKNADDYKFDKSKQKDAGHCQKRTIILGMKKLLKNLKLRVVEVVF